MKVSFSADRKGIDMIHRYLRFNVVVVILVLLNSNYAMSKRVRDEEPKGTSPLYAMGDNTQNVKETFLDTLDKGRELAPTDKDFSPILAETTVATQQAGAGKTEVPNGFRIQVIASSQIEKVRAEQKSLETRVRYPLYIIVTPPYYKLVAGDFIKRGDADAAAAKLKELGYADAWVVRSKVWTSR
jgi:hypothetical protein